MLKRGIIYIAVLIVLSTFAYSAPTDGFHTWSGAWDNTTGQGVENVNTTIISHIDMGFGEGTCECESSGIILSDSNGDWSATSLEADFRWNGNGVSAFCNIGPFASGNECRSFLIEDDLAYAFPDNSTNLECTSQFALIGSASTSFQCYNNEDIWTIEYFDCDNEKVRDIAIIGSPTEDPDNDGLTNTNERLWDLDPEDDDTDSDGLIDGDTIYSFLDSCPKHCNDYCEPRNSGHWNSVTCTQTPGYDYIMIDDYNYKVNHLSYVFNEEDGLKPTYWFTLYSQWKYEDSNTDLADEWKNVSYNDSAWAAGNAYLGFNEFLISTNLSYGPDPQNKTITYYFRKYFNLSNASNIDNMQFNIDYDDGFVAYLNGVELTRSSGASNDHFTTVPYHESTIGDVPSNWLAYNLTTQELNSLVEGENVLAIEMHQTRHTASGKVNSSDIVLGAYMVSYDTVTSSNILNTTADACTILSTNTTSRDQLKKELLTTWYNVVSSNICYSYEISSIGNCSDIAPETVEELIGYAEFVLINNISSEYTKIKDQLESLNTGQCLDCAECKEPGFMQIAVSSDNESVDLSWEDIGTSDYYIVYYSNNLTALRYVDEDDLSPHIWAHNTNENSWTDVNASTNVVRFYRVATVCPDVSHNIVDRIAAKQTYYFKASDDTDKRDNLFALIHNPNRTMSNFVEDLCDEYPVVCDTNLGIPTIQAIDRSNPDLQPWKTHPYSYHINDEYQMEESVGYKLLINQSYNMTEAGILNELMPLDFKASSDTDKRDNLFGDRYIEDDTFSIYLNAICVQHPQICDTNLGIPTIQAIDRTNPEIQPWTTHPYSYHINDDYGMLSGEGYKILVNESIIVILNNTVIR